MGDLLLSGVVTPAVLNGKYRQTCTFNGKPRYRKVGDESCWIYSNNGCGGPCWELGTTGEGVHFSAATDASTTGPPESGWGTHYPNGDSVNSPGSGTPRVTRAGAPAPSTHSSEAEEIKQLMIRARQLGYALVPL